ncbi:hypothetical protein ANANG_G00150170 [Anguilla anguilla]|uniref:Uncharacterized protein n=1 Tax=Anguilla anguilla TaxID=7936 RepID=A0A9D3M7R2_ANGAN|nr:hypothetical protein ANANG_G00150170 [Anguilla anguilla]
MHPRRMSHRRILTLTWVPPRLRKRLSPSSRSSESSRRRNMRNPRASRVLLSPIIRGRCGGSLLHVTVITPNRLGEGAVGVWGPIYH